MREFGMLADGSPVRLFSLDNGKGCRVSLSEFGAAITSILIPDNNGISGEICLGYDSVEPYVKDSESIGVSIGRYANRLANSCFTLNGKNHLLDANLPPHHIHGGGRGFGKQHWQGQIIQDSTGSGVLFQRVSHDNECGYPGNLEVCISYRLSSDNNLSIDYSATADKDSYLNLTSHAYFNLAGTGEIYNHEICIHGDRVTPLNNELIAQGEITSVAGGPFDLRQSARMCAGLSNPDSQMRTVGGYDINYIIGANDGFLKKAALVFDPTSGRSLAINSTQPCLQFYTGNNLAGIPTRDGGILKKYAAFCLEAQDYPNGPNVDNFPTTALRAGKTYHQRIEYAFAWG